MSQRIEHMGGVVVATSILPGRRLALPNPALASVARYGGAGAALNLDQFIMGSQPCLSDPTKTIIPRAALDVLGLPETAGEWPEEVEDRTGRELPEDIEFHGTLRPYQFDAVCAAVAARHGVIVAPPGAGKTVTALALAHELGLKPLVLVHTKDLMDQWIAASEKFLGYPLDQVGAGKHTSTSPVGSVAMVQTLATWSRTQLDALARQHGVLLVDEAHHAPATTVLEILWDLGLPRRYGVSATPTRADGLTPILHWCLGPIVYQVRTEDLVDAGVAVSPLVRRVSTNFTFQMDKQVQIEKRYGYQAYWSAYKRDPESFITELKTSKIKTVRMVPPWEVAAFQALLRKNGMESGSLVDPKAMSECQKALCLDADRLALIRNIAMWLVNTGRKVLILGGRVQHCESIGRLLGAGAREWKPRDFTYDVKPRERRALVHVFPIRSGHLAKTRTIHARVLHAELPAKVRKRALADFKTFSRICVATTIADEGLDVPDIKAMIMAFPGRSEAKTIQRAGRSMRAVKGSLRPLIVDLVDGKIEVFESQWRARKTAYRKAGCEFSEPAKANKKR